MPDREREPAAGRAERSESPEAERAQSTEATRRTAEIREISEQIVDAVRVGTDETRRQVVLVDIDTPGGDNVRVRLRRDGEGFETRIRAESEGLARRLRRNRKRLRESAAEKDVMLKNIDIV